MKEIIQYRISVTQLCKEFAEKYFEESDWYIIGDINVWYWPLEVADYFFSIDNIACALNNNIPKEVLLKWHEESLEEYEKDWKVKINLYNYFLTKNGLSPLWLVK